MTVHDLSVRAADGAQQSLADYRGTTLLIVNVASKCGLTPQYEGLEKLHGDFRDRGLVVLGFPCNQFGGQEPGTAEEIAEFCSVNYDVTFPVFAKIDVNGPDADPLFVHLRAEQPGDFGPQYGRLYDVLAARSPEIIGTDDIKWNFTKFLVDGEGRVVARFEPPVLPDAIAGELDALLAAEPAR